MSAELYRARLLQRRQEILIARMRDALDELTEIASSAAIGSPAYVGINIKSRIDELRSIGQLTTFDIGKEFGPLPPGFDPDPDRESSSVRNALHDLVYGGEFATWMRRDNPALPYAAAREYDEAQALMIGIVGHPPVDPGVVK